MLQGWGSCFTPKTMNGDKPFWQWPMHNKAAQHNNDKLSGSNSQAENSPTRMPSRAGRSLPRSRLFPNPRNAMAPGRPRYPCTGLLPSPAQIKHRAGLCRWQQGRLADQPLPPRHLRPAALLPTPGCRLGRRAEGAAFLSPAIGAKPLGSVHRTPAPATAALVRPVPWSPPRAHTHAGPGKHLHPSLAQEGRSRI